MGKQDQRRLGLLTCAEVRERLYPFLLRTVSGSERLAILLHSDTCDGCRLSLQAVKGRLEHIAGVPATELDERRRERVRTHRRLWLGLLPVVPAAIAFALLIQQGIQMARYHYEWRFKGRLERALWRYREDNGSFPPSEAAPLSVYLTRPGKDGRPYLDASRERVDGAGHFLDRWDRPWIYRVPGAHNPWMFDLLSVGSNGRDDNGRRDDIANWDD